MLEQHYLVRQLIWCSIYPSWTPLYYFSGLGKALINKTLKIGFTYSFSKCPRMIPSPCPSGSLLATHLQCHELIHLGATKWRGGGARQRIRVLANGSLVGKQWKNLIYIWIGNGGCGAGKIESWSSEK